MAKRVDLTISIDLPSSHNADRLSIGADGSVKVFDKSGKELPPEKVERAVHYERAKGLKHQSRTIAERHFTSIGGLDELAQLSSFVALDTNTIEIEGINISAVFFIVCRLIRETNGFRVESLDGCGHVYELHNVPGNPEMLAILKVSHDTERGRGVSRENEIAFITDSDMGSHHAISRRDKPIYANQYLPKGFFLCYASADTGQELINKLIRFCDTQSTKYLSRLKSGETAFRTSGLASLEEDKSVHFRYIYYPDLSISNSLVTGVSLTKDSTYTVKFSGETDVL